MPLNAGERVLSGCFVLLQLRLLCLLERFDNGVQLRSAQWTRLSDQARAATK